MENYKFHMYRTSFRQRLMGQRPADVQMLKTALQDLKCLTDSQTNELIQDIEAYTTHYLLNPVRSVAEEAEKIANGHYRRVA